LPIQLRRSRRSPTLASWQPPRVRHENRGTAIQQDPPIFANPESVDECGVLADYPSDYYGEIGVNIVETASLER
jgi:hypothetical protein